MLHSIFVTTWQTPPTGGERKDGAATPPASGAETDKARRAKRAAGAH